MPTSGALDRVAQKLDLPFCRGSLWLQILWELNGCWKVVNLRRRKFWNRAVLAWLSIIAYRNKGKKPGEQLISVSDVVMEHWATYGRNYFSRYCNIPNLYKTCKCNLI